MFRKSLIALSFTSILTACGTGDGSTSSPVDPVNPQGEVTPDELSIEIVGRFSSGIYGQNAAETVQFHPQSKTAYAINGALNQIETISLAAIDDNEVAMAVGDNSLNSMAFDLAPKVAAKTAQIILGKANSIAISNNLMAVAVSAKIKTDNGAVLFFKLDENGNSSYLKAVEVGPLPDMVAFTHAGDKLLVANEGEPSKDYSIDPEGSISLIDINAGMPADIATAINFTTDLRFHDDAAEDVVSEKDKKRYLQNRGVKFAAVPGTTVAQDLEPEYITVAVDDKKAYISLQENNAIAVVNLNHRTVEVRGLGYKDWSKHEIDFSDKDKTANLKQINGLYGLYQPDALATYNHGGKTFVVSANEGDARHYIYRSDEATCIAVGHIFDEGDCIAYSEEVRVSSLKDNMSAAMFNRYENFGGQDGLGRLKVTSALGQIDDNEDDILDVYDRLYTFGARSFSIWDQNANLVFDSGDDFERITSSLLGDNFNSEYNKNAGDTRSDDKGGEPEAIAVGEINGRQYAFIGLERSSDLFAYDVTNPYAAHYVAHYNNRDFNTEFELDDRLENPCDVEQGMDCSQIAVSGDLGPESITFVKAEDSPNGNPLLIIGNQISGTVTVYQVKQK